jgi:putative FmdB family regulatory protein
VPTYQYACTSCGHQLEAVQTFSDDPLTECPECQGRLRKLFSSVGIVFKGSGFYRTDSRKPAKAEAGASAGGSSKESSGSSSSDSGSSGSSSSGASSSGASSSGASSSGGGSSGGGSANGGSSGGGSSSTKAASGASSA